MKLTFNLPDNTMGFSVILLTQKNGFTINQAIATLSTKMLEEGGIISFDEDGNFVELENEQ